ncbi:MAG: hypothetical protein IJV80_03565 [Clostridia bacterium]|nr:hypothetical protein [Clostridia bacterium]
MKNEKILLGLTAFGVILYPLNDLACILTLLAAILLSVFVYKDKAVTRTVLQPALCVSALYAWRAVNATFVNIITYFAQLGEDYYSSGLYESTTAFNRVIAAIYLLVFIAIVVLTVLFIFVKKTDIPFVGKLVDKMLGTEDKEENNSEE